MEYEVIEKEETAPPEPAIEQQGSEQPKQKKEKKPSRLKAFFKKLSIKRVLFVLVLLGVGGYFAIKVLTPAPEIIIPHRVVSLAPQDLRNTVDVTGNIESENASRIYSTLTYPITEVAVSVGDRVEEGQLLCRLDTDALESDIKAKEAGIWSTAGNNNLSIAQAQKELETARAYYDKGEDASILAAQSALESAERNLQTAEFDRRIADWDYDDALNENRDAKSDGNDPVYDRVDLGMKRDAVSKAEIAVAAAEAAVAEAKQKLARTQDDALAELKNLEDAVQRAKNSANQSSDYISLESLKEDIEKCTVLSPSAGTITAVYAKEGAGGNGLLFVVEDPATLIVESTVMEYDVNTVKPGQKVEIKSDATGSEIFLGEVLSISPTSLKDTDGRTVTGSTASFAMKIKVLDQDSALRIGMNVRASIITEEKPQSMAVLYDAVGTHPETGEPVVYVAREAQPAEVSAEEPQAPSYVATMISVTTGMETDLYWEIFSDELREGDLVLQDPNMLYDGMPVHIADPNNAYDMGLAGGMGGGRPGGAAVRMG